AYLLPEHLSLGGLEMNLGTHDRASYLLFKEGGWTRKRAGSVAEFMQAGQGGLSRIIVKSRRPPAPRWGILACNERRVASMMCRRRRLAAAGASGTAPRGVITTTKRPAFQWISSVPISCCVWLQSYCCCSPQLPRRRGSREDRCAARSTGSRKTCTLCSRGAAANNGSF